MACVFKRGGTTCAKAASAVCQEWGVGEGFCDDHIARVRSRLHSRNYSGDPISKQIDNPQGPYVEDLIKLFALMLDTSFCRSLMESLNNEIKGGAIQRAKDTNDERYKNAKRPDDKKYVRLSRVLEYYEGLCWFPTTHRLFTGALSSENYQQSIALGYMPKDAGAGAQHGEYSHRLQWHMVMRVLTAGFTVPKGNVWNHTPLDIFTHLGTEWAMGNGLWGVVFDNQDGKGYDNPAKLNMDLCGNFKWRSEEAELSAAKWRDDNKLLAFNARRRTSKRLALYSFALGELKKCSAEEQRLVGAMDVEQNVIGLVEKWKKLGAPKEERHRIYFETTKAVVIEKLAHEVWREFKLAHKSDIYVQDETESNALLRKGESLVTPETIWQSVNASYEGLNTTKYAYTDALGAYPKQ